jgi:hypothetical protein
VAYYINRQAGRYHETVDELDSKSEALKVLPEYQLSEHGRAYYYASPTCRDNWRE